ncbi:glycosyltransferase family 2 protein [Cetobacterium sp.]|uniref:glycosyltransferase family 2 protein n=1 Tax=Cetobacterium sp. TaxID=2071632 RepID=UPI003F320123
MKNPEITIIVPVYNVENYLKKCIDSILGQTFKDFELILINDGSTDKSGDICNSYKNIDSRIKVIHKENGGQSSARNLGLNIARGNYIGFVDSDDWIDSDMYECLYKMITKYQSDIGIIGINFIYSNRIRKSKDYKTVVINSKEAIYELIKHELFGNYFWSKLFKKELFQKNRFKEGIIFEDIDLLYKLFHESKSVVAKGVQKYNYLQRENSTVRNKEFRNDEFYVKEERLKFIERNYPEVQKLCEIDLYETALVNLGKFQFSEKRDIKSKDFIKIKEYLNKNINYSLKNKKIPLNTKIVLLALKINSLLYIFILKMLDIKNKRG